jgi:hypothetical protein
MVSPPSVAAPPPAAPTPAPALVTPAPAVVTASPAVSAPSPVAAFINFGAGPYPEASVITTGTGQAWFTSAQVAQLFGGQPNGQQRADFTNTVIQRVEQAFSLSGLHVTLTTDPNAPAAHTLSVVSNTTSSQMANAIGMTDIGANGFSFIDKMAGSSTSVDQLEWVLAHNIAHELMLAFGVPEVHDKTGNYLDAMNANWSMLTSPTATFSSGAVQDLLSKNFLSGPGTSPVMPGAQFAGPQAVPEPTTMVLWVAVTCGMVVARRRSSADR